jgi:hypothetical protein
LWSRAFLEPDTHHPKKEDAVSTINECVTKTMMQWLNSPPEQRGNVGEVIVAALRENGYMVLSTRELDIEIALAHEAGVYDATAEEGL